MGLIEPQQAGQGASGDHKDEGVPRSMVTIAGVDEAGRGPLAGPVVAAAVMLRPDVAIAGLKDSKLVSPIRRARLADTICEKSLAWSIGRATVEEIDALNILQASLLAMRRAIESLAVIPGRVLVDGNHCPELAPGPRTPPLSAVVGGDNRVAAISAASILAKESRDADMLELDAVYPGYGFARHKGYPTRAHIQALRALGPCPVHRRTFKPVRELFGNGPVRDMSRCVG